MNPILWSSPVFSLLVKDCTLPLIPLRPPMYKSSYTLIFGVFLSLTLPWNKPFWKAHRRPLPHSCCHSWSLTACTIERKPYSRIPDCAAFWEQPTLGLVPATSWAKSGTTSHSNHSNCRLWLFFSVWDKCLDLDCLWKTLVLFPLWCCEPQVSDTHPDSGHLHAVAVVHLVKKVHVIPDKSFYFPTPFCLSCLFRFLSILR